MNIINQGGDPESNLLFVNFNQDSTSLAVGTKKGYQLLSLHSVDRLEVLYENVSQETLQVERLFSSSLVAIVNLTNPRKLKICHFKKGTEICNYSYSNTILSVHLNRQRLVVCLEDSLHIHNIRDMKVLHTIKDTPPNLSGLCVLSTHNVNNFLAYPGSDQIGEVQIFNCLTLTFISRIDAHHSPLAALAFNVDGTKIATASEKGTVIRVFLSAEAEKIFELRRGVKRCVTIYSMSFSPDSAFLCCSSNTETVHVFKLEHEKEKPQEEPAGWMDYVGQALKTSATYLPGNVTELLNQNRDHATARLPFSDMRNVCTLTVINKILRLLVASQDGYLYIYNIDPIEGGECTLLKQHRLDGQPDPVGGELVPGGLVGGNDAQQQRQEEEDDEDELEGAAAAPIRRTGQAYPEYIASGSPLTPSDVKPVPIRSTNPFLHSPSTEGAESRSSKSRGVNADPLSNSPSESQPYRDPEQGDGNGSSPDSGTVPRLDDDNEFPPMSNKSSD